MHQSSKAFFEKDSVLMWSAVSAMVLWIINAVICIECRGDAYIV